MKNLIKIFVFFALIILFSSRANAQLPFTMPAVEVDTSCEDRIPKPTDSPSGWCQFWRSMGACSEGELTFKVVHDSGDDCTVTSDIGMNGSWHYYYSGNQYCSETNIGTPNYSKKCVPILSTETTQKNKQKLPLIDTSKTTKLPLGLSSSDGLLILMGVFLFIIVIIIKRKQIWPNKFAIIPADKEENKKIVNEKLEKNRKWLVDNSFATGVFSTMISLYVSFAPQSSQLMPLLKNYWLIFLIITILGLIFGLLEMKSPRKAFVYIGMFFNIIAIMLWLKIGLII